MIHIEHSVRQRDSIVTMECYCRRETHLAKRMTMSLCVAWLMVQQALCVMLVCRHALLSAPSSAAAGGSNAWLVLGWTQGAESHCCRLCRRTGQIAPNLLIHLVQFQ